MAYMAAARGPGSGSVLVDYPPAGWLPAHARPRESAGNTAGQSHTISSQLFGQSAAYVWCVCVQQLCSRLCELGDRALARLAAVEPAGHSLAAPAARAADAAGMASTQTRCSLLVHMRTAYQRLMQVEADAPAASSTRKHDTRTASEQQTRMFKAGQCAARVYETLLHPLAWLRGDLSISVSSSQGSRSALSELAAAMRDGGVTRVLASYAAVASSTDCSLPSILQHLRQPMAEGVQPLMPPLVSYENLVRVLLIQGMVHDDLLAQLEVGSHVPPSLLSPWQSAVRCMRMGQNVQQASAGAEAGAVRAWAAEGLRDGLRCAPRSIAL